MLSRCPYNNEEASRISVCPLAELDGYIQVLYNMQDVCNMQQHTDTHTSKPAHVQDSNYMFIKYLRSRSVNNGIDSDRSKQRAGLAELTPEQTFARTKRFTRVQQCKASVNGKLRETTITQEQRSRRSGRLASIHPQLF